MVCIRRALASWTIEAIIVGIVLRFDGSLRYPRDPGFPTSIQTRRAACAASIQLGGNNSDPILVGRLLSCTSSTTSAEAEYEGVLLGLEALRNIWRNNVGSTDTICTTNTANESVQVFGDCKTVIQQMSGQSRPRKLEFFHDRAMRVIQELEDLQPGLEFLFDHVPRSENHLCDRLSAFIVSEQQHNDHLDAMNKVRQLDGCCGVSIPKFLDRFMRKECNSVPFSERPQVYRGLARKAVKAENWLALLAVGEWWEAEVVGIWPRPKEEQQNDRNRVSRERLLFESLSIQIIALDAMKETKKAAARRRKHKYLLNRYATEHAKVEEQLHGPSWFEGYCDKAVIQLEDSRAVDENDKVWPSAVQKWSVRSSYL